MSKTKELTEYSSVQVWFNSLERASQRRGKELSTLTKRVRLSRLKKYCKLTQMNPDELIQEAKENIKKTGQRLDQYFEEKTKSVSRNTVVTDIGFLRGFYTHNDIMFPKSIGVPNRIKSAVSTRDEKTALYDYDSESGEVIFRNGTLQHFVQNLNFRDQTIALCLLSTGADATDLLKLNVDFVKDVMGKITESLRLFWHSNRAKTGVEFKTFFSQEATTFLKRYVEQEREGAKDDEPLFTGKTKNERLDVHALAMNFRFASDKIGIKLKHGQSSPFRPKRFRHLFRNACSIAHIDDGYTKMMMGHSDDISTSYMNRPKGLVEMEYVKVEPLLTVFGINKSEVNEIAQKMEAFKERVDEQAIELNETDKTVKNLETEVQSLKEQLKQAVAFIYSLEPILDKVSAGEKESKERKEAQQDFNKLVADLLKEHQIPKKSD